MRGPLETEPNSHIGVLSHGRDALKKSKNEIILFDFRTGIAVIAQGGERPEKHALRV